MKFPLLPILILLGITGACSRDPAPQPPASANPGPAGGTPVQPIDPAPGSAAPAVDAPRIEDLVRADDSLVSLQARLGAANAIADVLPGAEGETMSGWTLFPDDPTRRLSVYLDDSGQHPLMLLAGQDATAWTRSDGVRVGMSSDELQQLNGGPYGFMGFDWDYGGVVTDWRGGRLAPDGASAGPLTLCRPQAGDGPELEDYPMGDSEFPSDDPRLLANPARVCEFGVNIDPPAAAPAAG